MSFTIELSDSVFVTAQQFAKRAGRSVSEQLSHWSVVASVAEENPDLPYGMIKDIVASQREMEAGQAIDYEFESE